MVLELLQTGWGGGRGVASDLPEDTRKAMLPLKKYVSSLTMRRRVDAEDEGILNEVMHVRFPA